MAILFIIAIIVFIVLLIANPQKAILSVVLASILGFILLWLLGPLGIIIAIVAFFALYFSS